MTTKPSRRKPRHELTIDGERVRVFATRSEYEVIFGDGDIDDPEAEVRCYPKIGDGLAWADQARVERNAERRRIAEDDAKRGDHS